MVAPEIYTPRSFCNEGMQSAMPPVPETISRPRFSSASAPATWSVEYHLQTARKASL